MSPTWQIALYHFRREVFRRAYLITLLSLPLFVAFIIFMARIAGAVNNETIVLGVVDPGGFIRTTEVPDWDPDLALRFFDTRDQAVAALNEAEPGIDGVYLLPANYPVDRSIELLVQDDLPGWVPAHFADLLRANLLLEQPADVAARILNGSSVLYKATRAHREFPTSDPTAGLLAPLAVAVIHVFTIFPIAGIMAGALGDEKANRTIEVLITSVSTRELIGGKILAVTMMALLQIIVWIGFLVLAVWLGGSVFDLPWLQHLMIPWQDVVSIAIMAVPSFFFYGSMLVLVGSLIDDSETLQQVSGYMSLPLFFPLYFAAAILQNPQGGLAQVFALLPFTAVLTSGFQAIFTQLPLWRVAASAAISTLSGLGLVWLASRAFRIGMLRYGRRIRMRELIGRREAIGG